MNQPQFTGRNKEIMESWKRKHDLGKDKPLTTTTKMWKIHRFLKFYDNKPADEITRNDIEEYILWRKENNKPKTVHNDIVDLRLFFKELKPDNDFFEDIHSTAPKNKLPVSELVNEKDVQKLVDACSNQRDRTLIIMYWDSAARLSELLDLNIRNIEFDTRGAVIIPDGKTGMRRLRLIECVPDLQNWVNMHPMRDNPDAPLFVTSRKYGTEPRRLDSHTVQNMMKTVAKHAGVKKNIHPHAFRHGRITNRAKNGFIEAELRIIAGWEDNSKMASIYIHLSGADVEKKQLEKAGIIDIQEEEKKSPMLPKECPRCKTKNVYDSQYCMNCSMVLDPKIAIAIEEKEIEKSSEIDEMKKQIQGLQKFLGDIASANELKYDREVERHPEEYESEEIRPDVMPTTAMSVDEVKEQGNDFKGKMKKAIEEEEAKKLKELPTAPKPQI
jgi:integrase